jgi:D-alanyl-D-alanine dipeptidase
MKKALKCKPVILLVLFFFIVLTSCIQKSPRANPYNLDVVSTIQEYKNQVSQDSNKTLVDIEKKIPGIILDIRYATKSNFTNHKFYKSPRAFARKPVADSLLKIQNDLNKKGIGLKIFDAYKPYNITVKFYEIYPDTTFVAPPWTGSIHNTGCAIDVTLIDLKTGRELDMPTQFDDFTEKASHHYMDLPTSILQNRQLLLDIMVKYGFIQYDYEWWHYEYKDWKYFELMDISFEQLK